MQAINPRLFTARSRLRAHCARCNRAGYDYVVQAESGLMSITGPRTAKRARSACRRRPRPGQNAAIASSPRCAIAIAPAAASASTGRCSTRSSPALAKWLRACCSPARTHRATATRTRACSLPSFEASDGPFVLAVASESCGRDCRVLGREDCCANALCPQRRARSPIATPWCADMQAVFATAAGRARLALFADAGVPPRRSNRCAAALDSDIAHARGMQVELAGCRWSAVRSTCRRRRWSSLPPPRLGEHTDELAARFGFDATALRAAGAVR